MSYTISVIGDNTYSLTDEDAQNLIETLGKSKKPFMVVLEGDMVRSSQIKKISKDKLTMADVPSFDVDAIPEGKRCVGSHSIQLEINNLAMKEHPDEWAKYIRDKAWREKTRLKLRQMSDEWCDFKANECVCG